MIYYLWLALSWLSVTVDALCLGFLWKLLLPLSDLFSQFWHFVLITCCFTFMYGRVAWFTYSTLPHYSCACSTSDASYTGFFLGSCMSNVFCLIYFIKKKIMPLVFSFRLNCISRWGPSVVDLTVSVLFIVKCHTISYRWLYQMHFNSCR